MEGSQRLWHTETTAKIESAVKYAENMEDKSILLEEGLH